MSLDEATLKQALDRLPLDELERRVRALTAHAEELGRWLTKARELYRHRLEQLHGCGPMPTSTSLSPGNLEEVYLQTFETAQIARKALAQRLIDQALTDMTGFDAIAEAVGSLTNPELLEASDAAA